MLLPSYSSLQQAPYTSQPSFQTLISRWRGTPYQIYQGFVFRSIQIFQFSIWLYATNLNQPSLFCSLYIINYAAFQYAKLLGIVVLPWVWQFTVFSGPFNLFVYISSFSALVCPFLFPFTIDHKLGVCYFWFRAYMWYLVLMYWSMVFIYDFFFSGSLFTFRSANQCHCSLNPSYQSVTADGSQCWFTSVFSCICIKLSWFVLRGTPLW